MGKNQGPKGLIELISNIRNHPVPDIDVMLNYTDSKTFPVTPGVEVNEQRRREIREIEDLLLKWKQIKFQCAQKNLAKWLKLAE